MLETIDRELQQAENCRQLWVAHLERMVIDATIDRVYIAGRGRTREDRARSGKLSQDWARAYILKRNDRFEWVCDVLGYDPGAIRAGVRRKIGAGSKPIPKASRRGAVSVGDRTPPGTRHVAPGREFVPGGVSECRDIAGNLTYKRITYRKESGNMENYAVASSNIAGIDYDPINKVLYIRFKNGKKYAYLNVNAGDVIDFVNADSVGKHFAQHIRGQFKFYEVPQKEKGPED